MNKDLFYPKIRIPNEVRPKKTEIGTPQIVQGGERRKELLTVIRSSGLLYIQGKPHVRPVTMTCEDSLQKTLQSS